MSAPETAILGVADLPIAARRLTSSAWPFLLALLLGTTTGALLWLCYFPLAYGWLAWVALVPFLVMVIGERSRWRVFVGSWLAGLVFCVPALSWLRVAHPMMFYTWIALSVYCSLYFPLAAMLIRLLRRRTALPLVLVVPAVWVALEFVRAHLMGGFAWYFLAHSQHDYLPVIQIADVTGAYGVSFLIAAVNAFLVELIIDGPWFRSRFDLQRLTTVRGLIWHGVAVSVALVVALGYGAYRLSDASFTDGPRIALLQCNLAQGVRNDASDNDETAVKSVLKQNCALAHKATTATPRPDLLVWSETSFPYYWSQQPTDAGAASLDDETRADLQGTEKVARDMVYSWRTPLLLGVTRQVIRSNSEKPRYNSAVLVDRAGRTVSAYDKMHRVPFGEYVPLVETFPWMKAFTPYDHDFSVQAGQEFTRFELGTHRFGVVICYEDSDPSLARQYVDPGQGPAVDFLLNISNDGWFRGTIEHEQHLAICRFRAVECRRSVARAVNMGISAVIDGNGRVLAPSPAPQGFDIASGAPPLPVERWHEFKKMATVLTAVVPIDHRGSLYACWGDWLPTGCWLLVGGGLVLGLWRPRRIDQASAGERGA
jgi:apolipoprotein N-acyltransferase